LFRFLSQQPSINQTGVLTRDAGFFVAVVSNHHAIPPFHGGFHASTARVSCYRPLMPTLCDQIPNLSTAEKLVAMEALWSSLHQTFEDSAPPDWHREILNHRMGLIESGEAVYEDWNQVKKELRERTA
jgi:hypothetical protein